MLGLNNSKITTVRTSLYDLWFERTIQGLWKSVGLIICNRTFIIRLVASKDKNFCITTSLKCRLYPEVFEDWPLVCRKFVKVSKITIFHRKYTFLTTSNSNSLTFRIMSNRVRKVKIRRINIQCTSYPHFHLFTDVLVYINKCEVMNFPVLSTKLQAAGFVTRETSTIPLYEHCLNSVVNDANPPFRVPWCTSLDTARVCAGLHYIYGHVLAFCW